mmetsp:Transcript_2936/g.9636  ORF Transcript_2936/g.9636 Transcript_2936/m.9636 type:complete len:372 (-) Transcript_2936:358-1473(-)
MDGVPVLGHDLVRREERRHEADAEGAVLEEVPRVVEVHARGGVEVEEGERVGDRLDPHVTVGHAREDLLDGRARLVGGEGLRRGLGAREHHHVAQGAPGDHLRHEDGRHDELGARVQRLLGVLHRQDSAAAHHHLAVVALAEVREGVQAPGGGQGELHDLEAALDGGLHGRRRELGGRRAEHSARARGGKAPEHGLVLVHGAHVRVRREARPRGHAAARAPAGGPGGVELDPLGGEELPEGRLGLDGRLEGVVLARRARVFHELLLDDALDGLPVVGDLVHLLRGRGGHHDHAVLVADDRIPGAHDHAAALDDAITLPGLHDRGALLGRGGVGEDGEAVVEELVRVAHGAVGHQAADVALLEPEELDVAAD